MCRKLWSVLLFTLLLESWAWALDPALAVEKYLRQSWNPTNGLPRGRVEAITQDADGYLWIGTESGLARFDGQTFKQIKYSSQNELSPDRVLGLAADRQGLWVRLLQPSLLRYRAGSFAATGPRQSHDPLVTAMATTRDGSILFASRMDGIFTWANDSFKVKAPKERLPALNATVITEGTARDIWLGTSDTGLMRIQAGQVTPVTQGLPSLRINCLLAEREGKLYVGTESGLVHWDGHTLSTNHVPLELRSVRILAIARDRDGNVWVGTGKGLMRLNAEGHVVSVDPKLATDVTALFEDREGDVWAGSLSRLDRIKEGSLSIYRTGSSERMSSGGPVFADAQAKVWTATAPGALSLIHDAAVSSIQPPQLLTDRILSMDGGGNELLLGLEKNGLAHMNFQQGAYRVSFGEPRTGALSHPITAVKKAHDGSIWVGSVAGGVAHIENGRCTNYTNQNGLLSNTIFSISEGANSIMWFGTPSGLSRLSNGHWRSYGMGDGLPSREVYATFVDSAGVLWVGTINGVAYLGEERFNVSKATPDRPVFGVVQDRYDCLWVVTSDMVYRVNKSKLLDGSLRAEDIRIFGAFDGLPDFEGVRRNPTITSDVFGTIWISQPSGVVAINSERLNRASAPTIVHIDQVLVDGSVRDYSRPLKLDSDTKRVSIHYQGVNLSDPDRVRYRFRLDGFDRGWNDAGLGKEAVYTNLSPATYNFHVLASNSDQAWNGAESALSFTVVPAIWQTGWFRAVSAITLLIAALIAYRLRVLHLTQQVNLQFEARLAERNRIARDLHDTLLQSFQGLILRFQAVENILEEKPEKAKRSLETAIDYATRAVKEGRQAVQQLRTGQVGTDLVATLTSLGKELSVAETGWAEPTYHVLLEGEQRQLRPGLEDDLYRICREAVSNAFRHARATRIELDIQYDPKALRLRIRDDGKGMDPGMLAAGRRDGHWGLPGMRERASAISGRLEVWSDADRGTEIELIVPAQIAYARAEDSQKGGVFGRRS